MEVKENSKQYVILTWQEFESNYPRFFYDNGLGSQKINPTLTIYTKNYIFYRREYDGAEWFEYVPTKQYILDNADAFNDKNIIYKDGILFKLNMFYEMLYNLDSSDFDSDLQMLDCFLRNFDYKFDYNDLSEEVKNVIPIRKEYGVYVEEDDIAVAELEIYFKEIHYLLKDLDDL